MSAQLSVPRTDCCTGLKPLQSSSPRAAWAGTPLLQATPKNSAVAVMMPRSTLDLNLCTCDRSPHRLLMPDTCRYWDKNFIVLCDCDCYQVHQVVLQRIARCSYGQGNAYVVDSVCV